VIVLTLIFYGGLGCRLRGAENVLASPIQTVSKTGVMGVITYIAPHFCDMLIKYTSESLIFCINLNIVAFHSCPTKQITDPAMSSRSKQYEPSGELWCGKVFLATVDWA
jgi:hypothetical protein